ncbi:hypothetical protein AB0C88_40075 [Streptomyces chartreusis]|uniref:hypothetical protein n=1 Tax=Streptomyces chartreusis TaxID=1969 RepID=UPI0033C7C239
MTTAAVASVPSKVTSAVVRITGLEVAEVKVAVNDLRLPDEEELGPRPWPAWSGRGRARGMTGAEPGERRIGMSAALVEMNRRYGAPGVHRLQPSGLDVPAVRAVVTAPAVPPRTTPAGIRPSAASHRTPHVR